MVVLSAKFTILISWSPFCIPLVILSVLIKLEGTSIAILYNSLESRHIWRTRIMVKGLDKRLFILFLDLILVYHVNQLWSCEWVCLHIRAYAKQKRQNQLYGYYRKILLQFIWHINFVTNSRKGVKLFYF